MSLIHQILGAFCGIVKAGSKHFYMDLLQKLGWGTTMVAVFFGFS